MTPKRVIEILRFEIRRIVGAIHVGKSDEYVRVQIRERHWAELARNDIARAERYAVQCHRANQKLYSAVRQGDCRAVPDSVRVLGGSQRFPTSGIEDRSTRARGWRVLREREV